MEKTNQKTGGNVINAGEVLEEINMEKQKYSAFLKADEPFEKLKTIRLKIKKLELWLRADNSNVDMSQL